MASGVLDTHALLWWTLDPEKVSERAREACRQMEVEGGIASSISIWEIGIKVKRGTLVLPFELGVYAARLRELDWLELVPVDADLWLRNISLAWDHRDPADRTIVATASRYNLPLISKDEAIASFYARTIW